MGALTWVLVVLLAGLAARCGGKKELKVGLIMPLRGLFGFQRMAAACTMAVEDAKKAGYLKDVDIRWALYRLLGTCVEFGPTSILPLLLYICLYWIPQTNSILNMINQHSHVYICFTNIAFSGPNSSPICASCKRSNACVTAPCTWNEQNTVCLCRPRCLFNLRIMLRRALYDINMRKMMLND